MPPVKNKKSFKIGKKSSLVKKIMKVVGVLVISYLVWFILFGNEEPEFTTTPVPYSALIKEVDNIDKILITKYASSSGYKLKATLHDGNMLTTDLIGDDQLALVNNLALSKDLELTNATFKDNEALITGLQMLGIVSVTTVIMWGFSKILSTSLKGITDSIQVVAGGGMNGKGAPNDMTKSKAKLVEDSKVKLEDVAGIDDQKYEVEEIIDMLKNPKRYLEAGVKMPKGVLLEGGPGVGKSLLAKAMANEADVPFYSVSGAEFVELYVGVGSARMRSTFEEAREAAKEHGGCIVFIDEIDAIAKKRSTSPGGGNDERESTLNQLLVEVDGAEGEDGIIIMGATNRVDMLDPAVVRPGRFDRVIQIPNPDLKGREAILKVHSKNKKLSPKVTFTEIARRTSGFSGAELANVMNEAAVLMVRERCAAITMAHIDEAIDRTLMGPAKKSYKMPEETRQLVAYHEAGHAVLGLKLKGGVEVVNKITIVPRKDALGYVMSMPEEEAVLDTTDDLLNRIKGLLGGRIMENLKFGKCTTGASNDLMKATAIARAIVCDYGMSSLGVVQLRKTHGSALGSSYEESSMSDETRKLVDAEIKRILDECYEEAEAILKENMDAVELIVKTLLEYDTITKEQIEELMEKGHLDETKPELPEAKTEEVKVEGSLQLSVIEEGKE